MLSVVVPCLNEETGLHRLVTALAEHLSALDYEVLLVDDGSTDSSVATMRALREADPRVRYIALSRNFGKESAMLAGLSQARGEVVAIMDADLQHPPELLGPMLAKLDEGYDQVVARRTRGGDPMVRSVASRAYYRSMNRLIDVDLEDGVGDFRVLTRRAVTALLSLGEVNRFSKGLFSWIGFRTAVVDYDNVGRGSGASRWSFRDLVNYGIDGVVSFNSRPLRMAIWFGAIVSLVAFGYVLWVIFRAVVHGVVTPGYVTTLSVVTGLGGVQMIMLGVIGEYLGRIYAETKRRPHFLVRESSDDAPVAVVLGPEHGHFEQPAESTSVDQVEHEQRRAGGQQPPGA